MQKKKAKECRSQRKDPTDSISSQRTRRIEVTLSREIPKTIQVEPLPISSHQEKH
jgi:hypothetical protein